MTEWQAVLDGLVIGAVYAVLAAGFGLIIGVTGRFHFAYATTFVITVYITSALVDAGVPLYVSVAGGIVAAAISGVAIELLFYRPLARRAPNAALLAVFVTSLGLVIAGENAVQLIWGADTKQIATGYKLKPVDILGGTMTTLGLVTVGVALVVVLAVWAWLRVARYGRAIRGVQVNPDMARAVGINPDRVFLVVFALGSALCGVGAVLLTQRVGANPNAGLQPTFSALVVVFLAGLASSPVRFGIVGLIVGLLQSLATTWMGPAWSPVVIFGILFIYVSVTPFLGTLSARLPRRRRMEPEPA